MKTLLVIVSLASLGLCLLLCRTFDAVQSASKADVAQQEAQVAALCH